MEQLLNADVPSGREALADIPLPPFATAADHRRYLDMLQLYLALLDPGAPAPSTVILNGALADEAWMAGPGALSPTALVASLSSFFPAPWTPDALAEALARRNGAPVRQGDGWRWMGDPEFSATPRDGGGWEIVRFERGTVSKWVLTRDGDLVLLWMDHFRSRFSVPFGRGYELTDAVSLAPAVRAARRAHEVNTAYPYLVSWRTERDEALAES